MKDNIQRLMKLVSIVEQIADSEHFSQEQHLAQQYLKNIVAPKELDKLYHQVITLDNEQLSSGSNCNS